MDVLEIDECNYRNLRVTKGTKCDRQKEGLMPSGKAGNESKRP